MNCHIPKKELRAAKELLRKIPYAEARSECERLLEQFATRYQKLYPKAVETLMPRLGADGDLSCVDRDIRLGGISEGVNTHPYPSAPLVWSSRGY